MKKVFELFLMLLAHIITIVPYVVIFALLYLVKWLVIPDLPFSFLIILLAICIVIYDNVKKLVGRD